MFVGETFDVNKDDYGNVHSRVNFPQSVTCIFAQNAHAHLCTANH